MALSALWCVAGYLLWSYPQLGQDLLVATAGSLGGGVVAGRGVGPLEGPPEVVPVAVDVEAPLARPRRPNRVPLRQEELGQHPGDRKSTRLNSSHITISYAVFCLKKKKTTLSQPEPKTKIMIYDKKL